MSGNASDAEEALATIRRARPSIVIRPEVISALSEFELYLRDARIAKNLFSSLQVVTTRNNREASL
jgi:hypothetical protein